MVESRREEPAEGALWPWLGFWVQFALLGICIVLGAFAASNADAPGDYAAGIVLILGAAALAFWRLKNRFDGGPPGWRASFLVGGMWGLVVAIPLLTIIGLLGLFIASAWSYGSLHAAGIALFVAGAVIVFLDIKHVFDRIDTH
jgi:hypothetical protein